MKNPINTLIFGASYGSLLATKLALAGHHAKMVCTAAEAELFNQAGAIVRLPVKGREGLVEVNSRKLPGKLNACTPAEASPAGYDLVRLPTNFKSARFDSDAYTAILRRLETDIEAARFEGMELPVKLKVHDSVFVPLAKWAMLLAGNYRCIQKDGIRPIKEAVHGDPETSRAVYTWVMKLCVSLGASEKDMVPYEKYAAAAQSLVTPSS